MNNIPGYIRPNAEYIISLEEVDASFLERFKGITLYNGEEVPVIFFSPDIEIFKETQDSVIIIMPKDPVVDYARLNSEKNYYDKPTFNENGNLVSVESREFPEPMILGYEVRTFYRRQSDGVYIHSEILRRIRRDDYLTIKGYNYRLNALGSSRTWGTNFSRFGKMEAGRREFQSSFDFSVEAWLEISARETVKTVKEIGIRGVKLKGGE